MKTSVRMRTFFFMLILAVAAFAAHAADPERDPLALKDWRVDFSKMQRVDALSFLPQPNAVPSAASHYITMVPCRILDTRDPNGPYGGPVFGSTETRTYDIANSPCPVPSNASAYSFNIAVTGNAGSGFITAWPTGSTQPFVSSLNYTLDTNPNYAISNGIIIPAGTSGQVNFFASVSVHLIVDINGYFAEGVVTNLTAGAGLSGGGTGAVTVDIEAGGVTPAMLDATGSNSGDVLTSNGTSASWQAAAAASGTAGGDLSGTYPNPAIASTAGDNIITAINGGTSTINAARLPGFVFLSPASVQSTTSTNDVVNLRLDRTGNALGTSGTSDLLSLSASGLYGATPVDAERFRVDNAGGVLAVGGNAGTIPATGNGTRMMFHASKGAFRVGMVNGTQWDDTNVGNRSFATGKGTIASGNESFASGDGAEASGHQSAAFGLNTIASGQNSFAAGTAVEAGGTASIVVGNDATATHSGCFLFGDQVGGSTTLASTGTDQFLVRAAGGATIYSSANLGAGVTLAPGGGSWSSVSDYARKENFELLNGEDVLRRIRSIPVSSWNYKSQDPSIRHIGPMAQDFFAAFGVGEDQKLINTIDIDGVTLAAAKALESRTVAQKAEIDALKQRNVELEERLAKLEALLKKQ